MIIEWLVSVAAGFWGWVGSLLPDWQLPPELADPNGALAAVMGLGSGLEPFVNWPLVGVLGAIPLSVWTVGVVWKGLRMAISHIPLFGGHG